MLKPPLKNESDEQKSPGEDKKSEPKPDVVINMPLLEIHTVGGVFANMPHVIMLWSVYQSWVMMHLTAPPYLSFIYLSLTSSWLSLVQVWSFYFRLEKADVGSLMSLFRNCYVNCSCLFLPFLWFFKNTYIIPLASLVTGFK